MFVMEQLDGIQGAVSVVMPAIALNRSQLDCNVLSMDSILIFSLEVMVRKHFTSAIDS